MHVVATAGHVDHGKSTLVRALTGTDPDRLDEERRRGLSIELGHCWTELDDVGEVAFVDVPGHQRFITTMLAGVGPAPVAMLVVAADDPWMPQAAEHLAALDALGVRHGVLVVSRSDLADPGPALARARAELGRTGLAAVPAVTLSARTGDGVDELRRVLAGVLRETPPPDPGADVRLWVDRAFHVPGTGTVVTGTLPAGTVTVGDSLEVDGEPVRVRGLESLGRPRESVTGVARVALDLGGRTPASLGRGSALLTPGAFVATSLVDVRLAGRRPDGDRTLPERPVLHVGADHCGSRARPLGEDHVRLGLEHPLPLRVGDRGLLRDPGSRAVWGFRVLDPEPAPLSRRGAAAARARELAAYDGSLAAELKLRGTVSRSALRRRGVPDEPVPEGTVAHDGWLVGPERAAELRGRLVALVRESATPLEPGLPTQAAARALDLPEHGLVAALVADPLVLDRGRVVERSSELPPELARALAGLHEALAAEPFAAPDAPTLRELGLDPATVAALHRGGHALRVADGVVLPAGADDLARDLLAALPQPFTASEARRALGTSRRVALPLLAHLDATGRTLRLPDDTRRVRDA